jgi:hypothetical protein
MKRFAIAAAALVLAASVSAEQIQVDPALKAYQRTSGSRATSTASAPTR